MCFKKDDLYIKILKYGKKNLTNGVTYKNVKSWLEDQGYKFEEYKDEKFFERIFNDIFFSPERGSVYEQCGDVVCNMQIEAYFRLLEHDELKSARRASFWATILATIAIFIAGGSTIYEIFFDKPTEIIIQKEQMGKIENIEFNPENINSNLQIIIENQNKIIDLYKSK
jgi:hypothetical protein